MTKDWCVDLGSFTVEADTHDEAVEKAREYLRENGADIDRVFPLNEDEGGSGEILELSDSAKETPLDRPGRANVHQVGGA